MSDKPLRALVDPGRDLPLPADSPAYARRRSLRFPCTVPARMRIGDIEYDVQCVDVGYEGVQVLASGDVQPAVGTEALITARTQTGAYGDSICVVRTEQTPQGTSILLKLSNRPS